MKFVRSLIHLSLSLLPFHAPSAWADTDFKPEHYKSNHKTGIDYRIHIPDNIDNNKLYPLVIFLHGAGQRGSDNISQLALGARAVMAFSKRSNMQAIIVAPQVPEGEQWVDTPWDADSHQMPEQPSRTMALVMELVANLSIDKPVDPARIYVTGLSMGGFGTWDIIQRMPDYFAAALPVCGGGDTDQAYKIAHMPIWAFHGDSDNVVKVGRSRDMIAALKQAGSEPKYTEYANVGHDSWVATYADNSVLTWLFSQTKQ